ncbi:GNAT family N-acetyltransferase [Paenibacillus sp. FSL H8-0537]|uniref:GNAT family N-acetyltransferase n=1 Tax=Paenibacillus sp. FSL H8-0537 TaxID=2921399 RepID=UPI003100A9F5
MKQTRNVAVLVYERVDTLDFAGPFDIFAISSGKDRDFNVYTVGETKKALLTLSGIAITPAHSFEDCPVPDLLIVPGGMGSRTEMHNEKLTNWIRQMAEHAELILSVCTGALLLAKANLLDGLRITTNRRALDLLRELAPSSAVIVENVRYVDNGKCVMSAGVTAGMDAALYVVARLHGQERAEQTAAIIEYDWHAEKGKNSLNLAVSALKAELEMKHATSDDLEAMLRLYKEAARWIYEAKGLRQWSEDSFTLAYLEGFIREKEVFVAYLQGELAGCFSVEWGDEPIWGEQFHTDAGYVHRLAVARSIKGQGIGGQLLAWSEAYIRGRGKAWMRLDCMAENPSLNAFYVSQGLTLCGRYDADGWSANLYEKKL